MPAPSQAPHSHPTKAFLGAFLALFLAACLDVPSSYEGSATLNSAMVKLVLNGDTTSVLEAPAGSSFTVLAVTDPASVASGLSFTWLSGGEALATGEAFLYDSTTALPDSLLLEDEAGNALGLAFTVVLNSAPEFLDFLTPAEGDTLVGEATDAFLFAWEATDLDGDSLTFIFEKDGTELPAGAWSSIYASGFDEGAHSVRVIVEDPYGDTDTSGTLSFYVVEAS